MTESTHESFIFELETIIRDRLAAGDTSSYTAKLAASGIERIAQKVGEEALEVALASVAPDRRTELCGEVGDLIFHLIVLLAVKDIRLSEIADLLAERHRDRSQS